MKYFQIAIDGPVAAGKGTVAKKLADTLGFMYFDTGATYRVATLIAKRNNLSFIDLDQQVPQVVQTLIELIEKSQIQLHKPEGDELDGRLITVELDGEDVSWKIKDESISAKVYIVAKIPQVRQVMVALQQKIAKSTNVVMEGRDITYRVLPDAQLKIYLDANQEERILRRIEQLTQQGQKVDSQTVAMEIKNRDYTDINRETDPLKIVPDAWHFDASGLSVDETIDRIIERVKRLRG